jgi:MEMO1 family protein
VLASSDLSHYHPYDDAEKIDHKTLHALEAWDYFSMSRNFQSRIWEACGGAPIVAAMIYAERMGANQAMVLKYANSGDVTGDHSRVVGYSADVFVKAAQRRGGGDSVLAHRPEKSELLALARKSVSTWFRRRNPYEPPASASEALNQERGAFVTLTEGGRICADASATPRPSSRST